MSKECAEQVRTFLPCLNCSSENEEYTVRTPLASVLGWIVLQGAEDMLAPSSTSQKQIALAGHPARDAKGGCAKRI